ncbi:MAG: hypothetical protein WBQ73_02515, partial [Candidatus Babeliales bacterium]
MGVYCGWAEVPLCEKREKEAREILDREMMQTKKVMTQGSFEGVYAYCAPLYDEDYLSHIRAHANQYT